MLKGPEIRRKGQNMSTALEKTRSMSRTALAKLAVSGQSLRKKMREEGQMMAQRLTVGGLGAATALGYGVILGATDWGREGGYIPGTEGDDGKGIRVDLVAGGLGIAAAIAMPKASWSDAALGVGLGLGLPAFSDLGRDIGDRIYNG